MSSGFETNELLYPITKGDVAGHAFHGNQYEAGQSGATEATPSQKTIKVTMPDGSTKEIPSLRAMRFKMSSAGQYFTQSMFAGYDLSGKRLADGEPDINYMIMQTGADKNGNDKYGAGWEVEATTRYENRPDMGRKDEVVGTTRTLDEAKRLATFHYREWKQSQS